MQEVHSTRLPSAACASFLSRADVQRQDQATMQRNTLLATRLHIPHPRLDLVPRPRLTHRLNEGATRKLTLITAPAGFGKTTLLSEWITQCRLATAWLSLNPGDNHPLRLFSYLIAALEPL